MKRGEMVLTVKWRPAEPTKQQTMAELDAEYEHAKNALLRLWGYEPREKKRAR